MSTVRAPFPHLVDNTMRGDFISCPTKFFWSFIEQWGPSTPSIHLHAGGAFATSLEVARRSFYEQGHSEAESLRAGLEALIKAYGAVQAPVTKNGDKSIENVIRAYDSYFQRYGLTTDPIKPHKLPNGKCMIEFTFAIPTDVPHPETGNPILYGGRSDMIGLMNGALYVTDEKTATQLGEQWANQWDLESQFTGYIKAAQDYGYFVAGAVIRGVGLLKTKITHSEAIIYRSTWQIDRWWGQLQRDIARMVASWKEGYYDLALSKNSCAAYGGCTFKMLCESPNPESWLPIHFRHRSWNPLEKDMGEHLLDNPKLLEQVAAPDIQI